MNEQTRAMLSMFHFSDEPTYFLAQDLWLAHRLKRYLDKGADINAFDDCEDTSFTRRGYQVIHYAAHYGLRHVYQVAIRKNPNLLESKSKSFLKETPFQIIARRISGTVSNHSSRKAYKALAFKMFEDGANVNATDVGKYTPLMRTTSAKLAELIISANGDIHARNYRNESALHTTVSLYPKHKMEKLHKERQVFSRDMQERLLLKTKVLVYAGIDTTLKNINGEMAIEYLEYFFNDNPSLKESEIYKFLKENTPSPYHTQSSKTPTLPNKDSNPQQPTKIADHKSTTRMTSNFWDLQNG